MEPADDSAVEPEVEARLLRRTAAVIAALAEVLGRLVIGRFGR